MFNELSKLIDRNYAIGYATPSALFLLLLVLLFDKAGIIDANSIYTSQLNNDPFLGTAFVVFLAWLVGLLLSAFNREFINLLSGLGKLNPLQYLKPRQVKSYQELSNLIKKDTAEVYTVHLGIHLEERLRPNDAESEKLRLAYLRLDEGRFRRSYYFPYDRTYDERLLRPTELGNIIRAFETYPRIMYGLDSAVGWNRLKYVIPRDAQEVIISAKSYFDFWMNLSILAGIFVIICCGVFLQQLVLRTLGTSIIWLLALLIANSFVVLFALSRCKDAAIIWGESIKAAFDVYLPVLAKTLGAKQEYGNYEYWTDFSVATTYKAFHRLGMYRGEFLDLDSDEITDISDSPDWDQEPQG